MTTQGVVSCVSVFHFQILYHPFNCQWIRFQMHHTRSVTLWFWTLCIWCQKHWMSYKYTCFYAALFYSPCISLRALNSGAKRLSRSLTCIFFFSYTITIQLYSYMLTQHSSDKANKRHAWTSWHIITWLPYIMGTVTLYILILFTARPCNGSMTALLYPN